MSIGQKNHFEDIKITAKKGVIIMFENDLKIMIGPTVRIGAQP
jgi:hypothetical protein